MKKVARRLAIDRCCGVRRLTLSDYRHMPWRNGGGTTTEIIVEPQNVDATKDRFLYRVSIADVASDGPFSRFEGCDRHIMLLAGAGMSLDCGVHGHIALVTPFAPHHFSGDWDVRGTLVAGPVRDFNLIVDRGKASSSLEGRALDRPATLPGEHHTVWIAHVLAGSLATAETGDTLVVDGSPLDLVPRTPAKVALARVTRR